MKDSQTLTGAQLSFIPAEAAVPILPRHAGQHPRTNHRASRGGARTRTQSDTRAHHSLITAARHQHVHSAAVSFERRERKNLAVLSMKGTRSSERERRRVSQRVGGGAAGGGGGRWAVGGRRAFGPPSWTWGIIGAKDGWRQQLLVPRCRSAPEAEPLISAQLCKATGCCPEAACAHTHTHTRASTVRKKKKRHQT